MNRYSEDILVEQSAIELFQLLEYDYKNCFRETFGPSGTLGRETSSNVVFIPILIEALIKLNRFLPAEAIDHAIEELTRDRSILNPVNANREIYSHAGWHKSLSKEHSDESCHLENDRQPVMLLGCVWCPLTEVPHMAAQLREIKRTA